MLNSPLQFSSRNDRRVSCLIVMAFLVLTILSIMRLEASANPYKLPSDPMLIVNAGMHIGRVESMAVDKSDRYLVVGTSDKTVSVWSLKENKLLRQLMFPVGPGTQGMIYAVDISPDGSTVVFGGATYTEANANYHVYVFDRASGEMKKRIGDLPSRIRAIKFSPDGRFFAVGLAKGGIRLFDAAELRLIASTQSFSGSVNGLDIDNRGRIFAATSDDFVMAFDKSLQVILKSPKESKGPKTVSVTPDGSLIAVSYTIGSGSLNVLSGESLQPLYAVDTSGLRDHLGINFDLDMSVWSKDGQMLFAGGKVWDDNGVFKVVVWKNKARQSHWKQVSVGRGFVRSLVPLNNGGFASATQEDSISAYSAENMRDEWPAPYFAFVNHSRRVSPFFFLSDDGNAIKFDSRLGFIIGSYSYYIGSGDYLFSLTEGMLDTEREHNLEMHRPLLESPGLALDGVWSPSLKPKLNGQPLQIDKDDKVRAHAVSHDGTFFTLGTQATIYCYDATGKTLWKKRVAYAVRSVNIAKRGNLVVVEHVDRTFRWYRTSDGKEIAAMYWHPTLIGDKWKYDWVVWTPDGYYHATPRGESMIGWHVNNGWDRAAYFYGVGQLRNKYYKPEIISERLAAPRTPSASLTPPTALTLPPVVQILEPADGTTVSTKEVTVRYRVESPSGEKAIEHRVLVNGRPVPTAKDIVLEKPDSPSFSKEATQARLKVSVPLPENTITIVAVTRDGLSSAPASVQVTRKTDVSGRAAEDAYVIKPKLYIFAVGASKFKKKPQLNLKFSAKDATDFVGAMKAQEGKLYREVTTKVLVDERATRESIIDGLQWLKRSATQHDVAMIFMSSHGVNESGQYYFIPSDYDPARLEASSVLFTYIKDAVSSIPGKVLVFLDTCHAGDVLGRRGAKSLPADINRVVNELVSAENGAVVFTSSTGRQQSFEDEKWNNGAFTRALIDGLKGKADLTGKGRITINMLDLYISERVKELTGGKQTPTTAKPETIQDFPIAVVR